jgi:hypothetical protein
MVTINITINVNVLPTTTAAPDGRDALRAALVRQPDGSYLNVLAIECPEFRAAIEEMGNRYTGDGGDAAVPRS